MHLWHVKFGMVFFRNSLMPPDKQKFNFVHCYDLIILLYMKNVLQKESVS